MKRILLSFALGATLVGSANAFSLTYNIFVTGGALTGSIGTLSIAQAPMSTTDVIVTVTNSRPQPEFFSTIGLNIKGSNGQTSGVTLKSETFPGVPTLKYDDNVASGFKFDLVLDLPTSNAQQGAQRFRNGTATATLTRASGLKPSDFGELSFGNNVAGGLVSMIHVQGTSASPNSVHYGAVPEPASMAALGLGLVALVRRRKA